MTPAYSKGNNFLVASKRINVFLPTHYDDAQTEAVLPEIEDALDAALQAVKDAFAEALPDAVVEDQ